MIALDTNVLVRFLVQNDPGEARVAAEVFDRLTDADPGFVSREVLVELVWVLERAYGYGYLEISGALDGLLCSTELLIEAADDVGPGPLRVDDRMAGPHSRGQEPMPVRRAWHRRYRASPLPCRAPCPWGRDGKEGQGRAGEAR